MRIKKSELKTANFNLKLTVFFLIQKKSVLAFLVIFRYLIYCFATSR